MDGVVDLAEYRQRRRGVYSDAPSWLGYLLERIGSSADFDEPSTETELFIDRILGFASRNPCEIPAGQERKVFFLRQEAYCFDYHVYDLPKRLVSEYGLLSLMDSKDDESAIALDTKTLAHLVNDNEQTLRKRRQYDMATHTMGWLFRTVGWYPSIPLPQKWFDFVLYQWDANILVAEYDLIDKFPGVVIPALRQQGISRNSERTLLRAHHDETESMRDLLQETRALALNLLKLERAAMPPGSWQDEP